MKTLKYCIDCIGCVYRLFVGGVYFPRLEWHTKRLIIESMHLSANDGHLIGLSFAGWPKKGLEVRKRSCIDIYTKANNDSTLVDVFCVDTIGNRSSNHFMGTITKGAEHDLSFRINNPGSKLAEIEVNISPVARWAPHTIKLNMPVLSKWGFMFEL